VPKQRDEVCTVRHQQASLGPSPVRAGRRESVGNRELSDSIALNPECRVDKDKKTAEAIFSNRREGSVQVVTSRSFDCDSENGQPQRRSCGLDSFQLWRGAGIGRIPQYADTRGRWHELFEEFEPFRDQIGMSVRQARGVPTRTSTLASQRPKPPSPRSAAQRSR